MKFTVGQLRETIGISPETFRHWKRVLPPFAARVGRTPAFSLGDLLSAAVISHLTDHCGVRVGHLATVAQKIADLCNAAPWAALDGKLLIVNIGSNDCVIVGDARDAASTEGALIVCFLTPIIAHLRDMLLRGQAPATQAHLRFPVIEVAKEHQATRRAK